MRHHDTWVAALGLGAGLSGVIGSIGRQICRISNVDFAEFTFYALR